MYGARARQADRARTNSSNAPLGALMLQSHTAFQAVFLNKEDFNFVVNLPVRSKNFPFALTEPAPSTNTSFGRLSGERRFAFDDDDDAPAPIPVQGRGISTGGIVTV